MRKLVLFAGLLLAAAFVPGTPAKAEAMLGCECVRLGAPAMCTATVLDCNVKVGGVCLAPCTYEPPKAAKKHHHARRKRRKCKAAPVSAAKRLRPRAEPLFLWLGGRVDAARRITH